LVYARLGRTNWLRAAELEAPGLPKCDSAETLRVVKDAIESGPSNAYRVTVQGIATATEVPFTPLTAMLDLLNLAKGHPP
jgi:hypothetical protein